MAILLDSTVLIDAARGRPAAERISALLERGEIPYVCAINTEEIHRGLRTEEVARVTTLLLAFRPAPLGLMEGALAGDWRREFAKRGITLDRADCLIAAAAVGVHAAVATGNPKHFPMDGVRVEHWPPGA